MVIMRCSSKQTAVMLPVWYAEQENAAQRSSDGIGRPALDMLCADVNLYWGIINTVKGTDIWYWMKTCLFVNNTDLQETRSTVPLTEMGTRNISWG